MQSFLSVYLSDGRLCVHLGLQDAQTSKSPLIISAQAYNDGMLHSVFLSRQGKE